MAHIEVLPECKPHFELLKTHLDESKGTRDKVIAYGEQLKTVFSTLDDLKDIRKTVIGSTITIVVTIVIAAFGVAVSYGRTLEKVERLDRLYSQAQ